MILNQDPAVQRRILSRISNNNPFNPTGVTLSGLHHLLSLVDRAKCYCKWSYLTIYQQVLASVYFVLLYYHFVWVSVLNRDAIYSPLISAVRGWFVHWRWDSLCLHMRACIPEGLWYNFLVCDYSCFSFYHRFASIIVCPSWFFNSSGFPIWVIHIFFTLRFGAIFSKVNAAIKQKNCPFVLTWIDITLKHNTLQGLQCDGTQMESRGQCH